MADSVVSTALSEHQLIVTALIGDVAKTAEKTIVAGRNDSEMPILIVNADVTGATVFHYG